MKTDIFWELVKNYFETNKYFITKHHLDSYNDFVEHMIPRVLKTLNPIVLRKTREDKKTEKHRIELYVGKKDHTGIYFDHPTITNEGNTRLMFPNDARLHDLTYAVNLYCDIEIIHYNNGEKGETTLLEKVEICRLPIMLHSKLCILSNKDHHILKEMGECIYDQGGYFIIDGKEKVIITQERNITNQVFIHESNDKKYSYNAFIRCISEESSVFPKRIDFNVFSHEYFKGLRANAIEVKIPHLKKEIPLFVLFRCLGIESDQDILQCIIGSNLETDEAKLFLDFLYSSITDGNIVYTKDQALKYVKRFTEYGTESNVEYVMNEHLFPNIDYDFAKFDKSGITNEENDRNKRIYNISKAMFLGHIVHKIVRVALKMDLPTDRDNYMFRRVAISGFLMGDLFKDFYNEFRNHVYGKLDSNYMGGNWFARDVINRSVTEANKNDIFNPMIISDGFTRSLKGSWGIRKETSGISQDLDRISFIAFMSHLRRVSSPMDPSVKIRKPHELNTSQFGIMCPVESPDGQNIGLIKNLAIMCHISFKTKSNQILKAITKYFDIIFLENLLRGSSLSSQMVKIMINNTWIGVIYEKEANEFVEFIRLLRRNAMINIFTSVSWNIIGKSINILTDEGRCTRPLLIVDKESQVPYLFKNKSIIKSIFLSSLDEKNKKPNWYLLAKGKTIKTEEFNVYDDTFKDPKNYFDYDGDTKNKVKMRRFFAHKMQQNIAPLEFLDVEEVNTSMIAMMPKDLKLKPQQGDLAKYTHLEIHPSLMLSAYTSTISFANHNQAPRNIFSGAQGKQAIGIYASNYNNRIDTMSYILHYPQKRLTSTRYVDYLNLSQLPNGENLIVAIATYTGYNQEDSIIYNKDSIDRGMFNITAFKSYITHEESNKKTGERIIFANPYELKAQGKPIEITKYANYKKIDKNGYPKINETIGEGDVIVGRIREEDNILERKNNEKSLDDIFSNNSSKNKKYTNLVDVADKTLGGKIDKVYVKQNYTTGLRDMKIRLRKFKTPELGDKASSTHGQKGICGLILPAQSMPFTKDGIVPDIIINPHAIPSRMTIGHLLECVLNKVAVKEGMFIDATPFENTDLEYYFDQLEKNGLERYGNEILYDGQTGNQIKTDIFFGPTYYYRLKHMVSDKINYRNKGKIQGMTMQPTKGRSNEGGLKIGEMESSAIVAHGMMSFIKESMMERSDKNKFYVDKQTGEMIGDINSKLNFYNGHLDFAPIEIPHAFKLFTQELKTMCIDTKFHISPEMDVDEIAMQNNFDDYIDNFDEDLDDDNILKDNLTLE